MDEKYLAFTPYRSGLGNVIMSYECALAFAYITKRKLILPPKFYLTHITPYPKKNFAPIWDIFNEKVTKEEFDIVDFYDHEEFKGNYRRLETDRSWFENLPKFSEDCYEWIAPDRQYNLTSSNLCFVNNADQYKDSEDFKKFLYERVVIDLDRPEKYLLFESNLFQNFWYMIYPGGPAERNKLKDKVNRVMRYQQKYYHMFHNTIMSKIGPYNAVHVRRNDFFVQFSYSIQSVDDGQKLASQLERVFDTGKPLYIATDEKDLSFFDPVRKLYPKIYFNADLGDQYSKLEQAILDQIICTRAEEFYGIQNSTFSRRINVMRGLEGRVARDNMGINNLDNPWVEEGFFPWHKRGEKVWSWNQSAYLQWTKEDVS